MTDLPLAGHLPQAILFVRRMGQSSWDMLVDLGHSRTLLKLSHFSHLPGVSRTQSEYPYCRRKVVAHTA